MDCPQSVTEEDLVLNESFNRWVKKTHKADELYWKEWLQKNPEKRSIVERARQMVLSLSSPENALPEYEVAQAWDSLQQVLQSRKVTRSRQQLNGAQYNRWYVAVAVFIGVLVSGLFIGKMYIYNQPVYYHTKYGETKIIRLPDGSQAVLNGNTSLQYKTSWPFKKDREVWLEGEAYFCVKKSQFTDNAKFIVHTAKLYVEVLGTQFNVSDRKKVTRVVLDEGQVSIKPLQATESAPLIMKPGELVEYTLTKAAVIKKLANSQMYSSWKHKKMIFDATSMQEIAEQIEATYGLQVVFADRELAQRKLTGTIPSDNIDTLLLTLSKLFNITTYKNNNQIIIKSNTF